MRRGEPWGQVMKIFFFQPDFGKKSHGKNEGTSQLTEAFLIFLERSLRFHQTDGTQDSVRQWLTSTGPWRRIKLLPSGSPLNQAFDPQRSSTMAEFLSKKPTKPQKDQSPKITGAGRPNRDLRAFMIVLPCPVRCWESKSTSAFSSKLVAL